MIFSNVHRPFIIRFLSLVVVTLLAFCVPACSDNDDSGLALISCRTCSGKISKNAFDCPHCGEPRPRPVSRRAFAKSKAASIAELITLYHLQSGLSEVPDGFDLKLLLLAPYDGGAPGGPFLSKAEDILDPWGQPFEVYAPGEINHDFDVMSWGEDGKPGGEGENEDVTQ
jgi:hypothetical protein